MLRSIQALRAVAATGVVVHHAAGLGGLDGAARVGAAGVDLFFVVSGFIMATIATDRSPGRFLADRAWRIFPLWLIALTPWLVVRENDWQTLLTSVTLWPIWGNAFHMPALFVGWSLCFELLFYGGFAVALAKRAVVPLAFFAAAVLLAPFTESAFLDYVGSPLIFEFLAGVAIARLPFRESFGLPLLLVGIAWLAVAPVDFDGIVYGDLAFLRLAAWGVPAALIVYSARCLERRFGRLFDLPVLLGNASYAIYLFHPLAIGFSIALGLIPAIAISLIVGLIVHLAVERPMMALRRSSRSKQRIAEGSGTAAGDAPLGSPSATSSAG